MKRINAFSRAALKFSYDAGFFKSPVDLKRFVDGQFINQALNEMK